MAQATQQRTSTLKLNLLNLIDGKPPAGLADLSISEARRLKEVAEGVRKHSSYAALRSDASVLASFYGVRVERLDPDPVEVRG